VGGCIRAHVLELYAKFNVLPLDKLRNHQIIVLVFKCLNYAHLLRACLGGAVGSVAVRTV